MIVPLAIVECGKLWSSFLFFGMYVVLCTTLRNISNIM